MRTILIISACLCVSLAARADDVPSTQALPPAPAPQIQTPDTERAVPMAPVPGDQKKFDAALAAYDGKDYTTAYKLFTELADEYDLAAMRNVALMTRDGLGCDKDLDKAEDMMKEAARRGLPTAQSDLAEMLLDGDPPDPKAALPWLEAASEAGHPVAQYRLGQLYEAGEVVPKDVGVAEVLYAEAAKHGVPGALERLKALKGWTQTPPELADKPPPAKP